MIEILQTGDENIFGLSIEGRVEADDVERVFGAMKGAGGDDGKLRFYVEARNVGVTDISAEAVKEDLRWWLRNPGFISRMEKAVLVTDSRWLKRLFQVECALIPTLTGKAFSSAEKAEAMEWLRADQRAASRIDLTLSELVETATLKAAGGFALGLLLADLFSRAQRKRIAGAILLVGFAAGIPLGIKVLNNNRRLLAP